MKYLRNIGIVVFATSLLMGALWSQKKITYPTATQTYSQIVRYFATPVEAGSFYTEILKKARSLWSSFTTQGSAGGGASSGGAVLVPQPFGGNVIVSIPCLCSGSWAFYIRPVKGIPGPYNVTMTSIKNWTPMLVIPGSYVLGTSYPGGICSVFVVVACFNFQTQQTVSFVTGMGTSLLP